MGLISIKTPNRLNSFLGETILLLTNLVAITLAAAAAFSLLGVRITGTHPSGWARRVVIVLCLLTLFLLIPLVSNVAEQKRRSQAKPLIYPVAYDTQQAVAEYLASVPGVSLITIARVSFEPGSPVSVLLYASEPLPPGLKQEVTTFGEAFNPDTGQWERF